MPRVPRPQVEDAPPWMNDTMSRLADGTRQQVESPWTRISKDETWTYQHGMNEIPWLVDVIESDAANGDNPSAASSVSVTKSKDGVAVKNNGSTRYFKVRVM